jgi:hypothetical protein
MVQGKETRLNFVGQVETYAIDEEAERWQCRLGRNVRFPQRATISTYLFFAF